jgi:hypothetical protein
MRLRESHFILFAALLPILPPDRSAEPGSVPRPAPVAHRLSAAGDAPLSMALPA